MLRGSKKSHKKIFRTECVLEDGLLFKLRENDNGSMRHKCKSIEAGFGRDTTREKLANRFFWTSMYQDIDEYIKTCEKCQKV